MEFFEQYIISIDMDRLLIRHAETINFKCIEFNLLVLVTRFDINNVFDRVSRACMFMHYVHMGLISQ